MYIYMYVGISSRVFPVSEMVGTYGLLNTLRFLGIFIELQRVLLQQSAGILFVYYYDITSIFQ
jgi:hypothetical protein